MAWLNQRRQRTPRSESEINITPMLDVVFILLIFFIVTTSFVKERGLPLSSSSRSNQSEQIPAPPLLLQINALGQFQLAQQSIQASALRARLAAMHAQRPEQALIISAHPDSPVEAVVLALDAGRLAGIENLQVARQRLSLAAN